MDGILLKSWDLPGDALCGLHSCMFVDLSVIQFYLEFLKSIFCWVEIGQLSRPLKKIEFLCRHSAGTLRSMFIVLIYLCCEAQSEHQ